jgi:hypothetical protein
LHRTVYTRLHSHICSKQGQISMLTQL